MIKTVTLTGTEEKVAFAGTHTIYWVQNLGGGDILAGLEPELADGKDNVLIVPSGGTGYVRLDTGTKTVYLSGAGKVQVYGTNNAFCPFKSAPKGGDYITSSGSEITAGTVDYPLLALNLYGSTTDGVSVGGEGIDIVTRNNDNIAVISYRTTGNIITSQPCSAIAKIDDTVTFSVDGGTSYQWQQDTSGDGNFTNIDTVTGRSKSFNITGAAFRNRYQYRCIVTDADGNTETSNIATLYVMSAAWSGTSGSITPFTLEPLQSVGEVRDELVYSADGTGKIIRRIADGAVLDVPTETEFTSAEMAAWQKLQTWNGVTVISNSAGAEMSVKVATNPMLADYIKPVIDGLAARYEARIAALESAVVSNN